MATAVDVGLVSASSTGDFVLTLSGGGLTSERVLTVGDPLGTTGWRVAPSYTTAVESRIASAASTRDDRTLWKHWFPGFLLLVALGLVATGLRGLDDRPTAPGGAGAPDTPPADAGRPGRKHHVST